LGFKDNVCKDTLSSQSTYKINSGCPYYKASIAPNPKLLNDFEPSKEQLEKVHGGIMEKVNELWLQISSKKPFLTLIINAKPSILILPKFKLVFCLLYDIKLVNLDNYKFFICEVMVL
jgi:hypothetical protein